MGEAYLGSSAIACETCRAGLPDAATACASEAATPPVPVAVEGRSKGVNDPAGTDCGCKGGKAPAPIIPAVERRVDEGGDSLAAANLACNLASAGETCGTGPTLRACTRCGDSGCATVCTVVVGCTVLWGDSWDAAATGDNISAPKDDDSAEVNADGIATVADTTEDSDTDNGAAAAAAPKGTTTAWSLVLTWTALGERPCSGDGAGDIDPPLSALACSTDAAGMVSRILRCTASTVEYTAK